MKTIQQKLSEKLAKCPGAVLTEVPATEYAEGSIVVDPVCSRDALEYLKRRFHVEQQIGIEQTGELKFVIRPRLRKVIAGKRVTVKHQRPVQFELPLG